MTGRPWSVTRSGHGRRRGGAAFILILLLVVAACAGRRGTAADSPPPPAAVVAVDSAAPPPSGPTPRDTIPFEDVFGVTEYALAREKLQEELDPEAFTVYLIADMEGLAGAVRNATEMRPEYRGGHPEHQRFRQELTEELNAAIEGARAAGATQFVVNDGHGGTLFRNTLPEELDPDALLIRGYPKPIVMSTGLNPHVDAVFLVGGHADAGSPGVIAHNFAFDSISVNGRRLNEAGIAAFHAGEFGAPLALVTGDDALTAETAQMVGELETVTVKHAFGRSAAAVLSPERAQTMIRDAAERAVRRVRQGEITPLRLEKPYRVEFCLRSTYEPWVAELVARIEGIFPSGGTGCFAYRSESAEDVGNMINKVEWVVLKP